MTSRAHRIGQGREVMVHRRTMPGGSAEAMDLPKERKPALAASVPEAERGGAFTLTEDDVEALFVES